MIIFDSLAYLDFQTGSVIVQAIVGAVAGIALFGRRVVTTIKQKLGLISLDEDDKLEVRKVEKTENTSTTKSDSKKSTSTTKKSNSKKSAKKSSRK